MHFGTTITLLGMVFYWVSHFSLDLTADKVFDSRIQLNSAHFLRDSLVSINKSQNFAFILNSWARQNIYAVPKNHSRTCYVSGWTEHIYFLVTAAEFMINNVLSELKFDPRVSQSKHIS